MKQYLSVFLLLICVLVGCGGKTTAYDKSVATDSVEASGDASGDVSTAGLTIAYSTIADGDEAVWAGYLWEELEAVCAENGWEFDALSADGVSSVQDTQIDELIAEDPDYFIVFAGDRQMADEWVKKIHNAGIPVIMAGIDASASAQAYVSAFVGPDQEALAAQLAMDMILANGESAGWNVVTVSGFEAQEDYRLREQGYEKTLSYFSNYTLLANEYAGISADAAKTIMENYIDTYGTQIDAVVCYDEEFVSGVREALSDAGMEDVQIYAIGGSDALFESIADGTVAEVALMSASEIVQGCADVIIGLEVGVIPDHYNYTERIYVTSDNVQDYLVSEE